MYKTYSIYIELASHQTGKHLAQHHLPVALRLLLPLSYLCPSPTHLAHLLARTHTHTPQTTNHTHSPCHCIVGPFSLLPNLSPHSSIAPSLADLPEPVQDQTIAVYIYLASSCDAISRTLQKGLRNGAIKVHRGSKGHHLRSSARLLASTGSTWNRQLPRWGERGDSCVH